MSSRLTTKCRVCGSGEASHFLTVNGSIYRRCPQCFATFIDASQFPSAEEEKQRYELHENDPQDEGYLEHLRRLSVPLIERLKPQDEGLDYGCGKVPALARMIEAAGHKMELYDPFFHPDRSVLEKKYDFITCSEVIEHFHAPADEFKILDAMLKPGGLLAVMTCFLDDDSKFADWHYRRDRTHVVFYKEETLRRVAQINGWDFEVPAKDIAMFTKPAK